MNQTEHVSLRETQALRHKSRGKAMTVRKYKKRTGKTPAPNQIHRRKSRSGAIKEYVKIYAHSDSSSWSFEESDAEVVEQNKVIDDGSIVVDDEQLPEKFENAAHMLFCSASSGAGSKRSRLSATDLEADLKEHALSPAEKRLKKDASAAIEGAKYGAGATISFDDAAPEKVEEVSMLARALRKNRFLRRRHPQRSIGHTRCIVAA